MLLVLSNGTYEISEEAAATLTDALENRLTTVAIELDIFDEGNPCRTVLATNHIVAIIDYRRPTAEIVGIASGKVRSLTF